MKPAGIVLHGPSSSGKSSLGRALLEIAPVPAFHVSLDAFVTMSTLRDMQSGGSTHTPEAGAAAIRSFVREHPH